MKQEEYILRHKNIFTPRYKIVAVLESHESILWHEEPVNASAAAENIQGAPENTSGATENTSAPTQASAPDAENKIYITEEYPLLPSVPANFKNPKSKENSLLNPTLSINLSAAENIPEGNRALPVNSIYAGAENYPLTVKKYVSCIILEKKYAELTDSWCTATFSLSKNKANETTTIASVGDMMFARGVQEVLLSEDGISKVFTDTLPVIHDSDFAIGNLEGVVTDSWSNAIKTYTFKFKKAILPKLMEAGFDYLMQTNNHCYDYGESGFKDTLKAFAEYKIPSSGIGYNKDEAKKFYHTTVNGLPVSVISCGAFPVERSGFNGEKTATATDTRAGILWQSDTLLEDIKKEKDEGWFVIVNVHGGEEYHFAPTKKQRAFYESLCDHGADIVFGSHPHVLQPTEWHGKSLIVYSMGNFIFNGMEGMRGGTDSVVVKTGVVNGRVCYVEQYPAKIETNKVSLAK